MNSVRKKNYLTVFIFAAIFASFTSAGIAGNVNKISKEELKKIMDNDSVSIVDARRSGDWGSSEFKIKGAERLDPQAFNTWSDKYPKDNTIILYCA